MFRILLLLILISCSGNSQKISKDDIKFKQLDSISNWFLIQNNQGKWGYADKELNIKIPIKYDDAGIFSDNGKVYIKENDKYGYYDLKGNIVIPIKYAYAWYFQDNGLAPVCVGKNKCGFIDENGKEIVPAIYSSIKFGQLDNIIAAKNASKWAFFNNKGKQITDFIFDDIYTSYKQVNNNERDTFFKNGAVLVLRKNKYEFLNEQFKPAFSQYQFDFAFPFDTNGNAVVKKNGKFGVINNLGETKVAFEKDMIQAFDKYDTGQIGSYRSQSGRTTEIYDKNFNLFIKTEDKNITSTFFKIRNKRKEVFIFKNEQSKTGVITKDKEVIIPFEYDDLREIEGTSFLWASIGDFNGIITEQGQTKIPIKYKEIYSVYDKFDNEDEIGKLLFIADGMMIDINNNVVISGYDAIAPIYYNHNNLIVSKNKKFGIIDVNKKILLPLEYDEISNWVEYGPEGKHFIVKKGKYGLIEKETFKTIIPPVYDKFDQRENLIFVSKNDKAGILDLNNKEICPFIFDEVRPHKYFGYDDGRNKLFYSKKGKKFFQITYTGKIEKEISEKEYKINTEH
ncbi:WG repeat-containing protein [Chryseobacterium sp. MMS23-Vi53]|uniref:WG repeat-containing protein n=1 Tax=Chryseobacterium sp. MMS23-Vi53 TaxID=3386644 RepID=UPI0039EB8C7D